MAAAQHRIPVRDEHAVQRQLQQRPESFANGFLAALAYPAGRADAQRVTEQDVADDDRAMLRDAVDELGGTA